MSELINDMSKLCWLIEELHGSVLQTELSQKASGIRIAVEKLSVKNKQLELENKELKFVLSGVQGMLDQQKTYTANATREAVRLVDVATDYKRKLAALEKQIQEGELVPVEVVVKWSREPKEICHSPRVSLRWFAGNEYKLKQFAQERAKEVSCGG